MKLAIKNSMCFLLMALMSMLLIGCGGGGDSEKPESPALGAVITGEYFPLEIGSRWVFEVVIDDSLASPSRYLSMQEVERSRMLNGQNAQLIRSVNPENGDLINVAYIAKTSDAVRAIFDDNSAPIDILRLPLRSGDHFVQVDQKNVDAGADYDGDGLNETISLFTEVTVAGFEDVQTKAGVFTQALKVQGRGTRTYHFSKNNEQYVISYATTDWYAKGVGQVKQIETTHAINRDVTTTYNLQSYKVGSTTNDALAPSIIQILPAENSLQGGLPVIRIQFSEYIDIFSFDFDNVGLRDAQGKSVQGDMSYVDQVFTFTPQMALSSGVFTFHVGNTIADLLGNKLDHSLDLHFNVDADAPSVVVTTPSAMAKMVPLDSNITIQFNEAINPTSVSASSILLYLGGGRDIVPATVKVEGKNIILTPNSTLKRNQYYEVYVSSATQDLTGNALPEAYSFNFVTDTGLLPKVVATYPLSGSTVAQKSMSEITLDFNEELSDYSIGYGAIEMFKITGEKFEPVYFSKKLEGKRITITPDRILERDGQYQVCAYTTIRDLAGNNLREPYCFGFKVQTGILFPAKMIKMNSPSDAIAIGDVNGDGRNDVVMATNSGYMLGENNEFDFKLALFIQQQDGSLAAPVKYQLQKKPQCAASSIAIADIDNNGKPEIMVGAPYCGIEIFAQDESGLWSKREQLVTEHGAKIRAADLNHDGKMDIVGAGGATGSVSVWYQENGKLKAPVNYNLPYQLSVDLEVGDINGDGRQDVVAFSDASLSYILQLPKGGFSTPHYLDVDATNISGSVGVITAIDIGDVNGDGYSDIVSTANTNQPTTLNVFAQNSSHQFMAKSYSSAVNLPGAVEIGDVNKDGRNDVLVTHWGEKLSMFLQSADGTLQAEELYDITYGAAYGNNTLAVADINSDGYQDVVVVTSYGYLGILYNSGGAGSTAVGDLQLKAKPSLSKGNLGTMLYKPKLTKPLNTLPLR